MLTSDIVPLIPSNRSTTTTTSTGSSRAVRRRVIIIIVLVIALVLSEIVRDHDEEENIKSASTWILTDATTTNTTSTLVATESVGIIANINTSSTNTSTSTIMGSSNKSIIANMTRTNATTAYGHAAAANSAGVTDHDAGNSIVVMSTANTSDTTLSSAPTTAVNIMTTPSPTVSSSSRPEDVSSARTKGKSNSIDSTGDDTNITSTSSVNGKSDQEGVLVPDNHSGAATSIDRTTTPTTTDATSNAATTSTGNDDTSLARMSNFSSMNNSGSYPHNDTKITTANAINHQHANDNSFPVALSSANYTMASDIIKIMHLPNKREIHVHLKTPSAHRRCQRPKLRGRLSGPYLALLTWDNNSVYIGVNSTTRNSNDVDEVSPLPAEDILVAHYQVPSGGLYYLEIIALLCERITYHTNFVKTCLEEPSRHRITANNATVEILEPTEDMLSQPDYPLGFWKWKNSTKEHTPLLTRFQPTGCWHPTSAEAVTLLGCEDASDVRRFDDYTFVWNDNHTNDSQWHYVGKNYQGPEKVYNGWVVRGDVQQFKGDFHATVCVNGMSHSDLMVKQMNVLQVTQSIKVVLERTLISAPLQQINFAKQFQEMKAKFNCTRSLIAIGQWAASFSGTVPFLIDEWEYRVKQLVMDMRNAGVEPMFRALHLQPIGERQGVCPPGDWRAHVLEEYNQVLKRVGLEMNVTYFDTEFIMSPLWDSWSDWMHPANEPLWKECNFLMREMMKLPWK